ncbi:hypothetical protein SDJN02_13098, partial [Cucurbita argyrosperma subsp. argyrosperma]
MVAMNMAKRAFEGDLSEITTLCDAENLRELLARKRSDLFSTNAYKSGRLFRTEITAVLESGEHS